MGTATRPHPFLASYLASREDTKMKKQYMRYMLIIGSILYALPVAAQVSPTMPKTHRVRILQGPEIESCYDFLTIVRWTTNNPGGSPEHYGVVRYGVKPNALTQTAKSPIRLNPDHPSTIFRVRLSGLTVGSTYYYTVQSEESNRTNDGVKSGTKQFTVNPPPKDASSQPACR